MQVYSPARPLKPKVETLTGHAGKNRTKRRAVALGAHQPSLLWKDSMMATTNAYLKDIHGPISGRRFGFFEQFSLENGTTSFEALVTAAALQPHQTVLESWLRRRPTAAIRHAARLCVTSVWISPPRPSWRHDSNLRQPVAEFVEADAGDIPLPDASCDVVLSHMVLRIMNPVEPALSRSRRAEAQRHAPRLHSSIRRMHSSAEASRFSDG